MNFRGPYRMNPQDLAARRDKVVRHLIDVAGMSEKEAKAMVGKASGTGSDRPALSPEGVEVYERGVKRVIRSEPLKAIMLLLPRTGLRVGEIVTMTRDRVLEPEGRQPKFLVVGKNSDIREVTITDKAYGILQRYEEAYKPQDKSPHWLFPKAKGPDHVSTASVQAAVRALRRAEPELDTADFKLTPHVLRHTYASEHLRRGGNLDWLRDQAGWKGRKTAMLYYHL
jgi:integrase